MFVFSFVFEAVPRGGIAAAVACSARAPEGPPQTHVPCVCQGRVCGCVCSCDCGVVPLHSVVVVVVWCPSMLYDLLPLKSTSSHVLNLLVPWCTSTSLTLHQHTPQHVITPTSPQHSPAIRALHPTDPPPPLSTTIPATDTAPQTTPQTTIKRPKTATTTPSTPDAKRSSSTALQIGRFPDVSSPPVSSPHVVPPSPHVSSSHAAWSSSTPGTPQLTTMPTVVTGPSHHAKSHSGALGTTGTPSGRSVSGTRRGMSLVVPGSRGGVLDAVQRSTGSGTTRGGGGRGGGH